MWKSKSKIGIAIIRLVKLLNFFLVKIAQNSYMRRRRRRGKESKKKIKREKKVFTLIVERGGLCNCGQFFFSSVESVFTTCVYMCLYTHYYCGAYIRVTLPHPSHLSLLCSLAHDERSKQRLVLNRPFRIHLCSMRASLFNNQIKLLPITFFPAIHTNVILSSSSSISGCSKKKVSKNGFWSGISRSSSSSCWGMNA